MAISLSLLAGALCAIVNITVTAFHVHLLGTAGIFWPAAVGAVLLPFLGIRRSSDLFSMMGAASIATAMACGWQLY